MCDHEMLWRKRSELKDVGKRLTISSELGHSLFVLQNIYSTRDSTDFFLKGVIDDWWPGNQPCEISIQWNLNT